MYYNNPKYIIFFNDKVIFESNDFFKFERYVLATGITLKDIGCKRYNDKVEFYYEYVRG